jgi:hypothetical protein
MILILSTNPNTRDATVVIYKLFKALLWADWTLSITKPTLDGLRKNLGEDDIVKQQAK